MTRVDRLHAMRRRRNRTFLAAAGLLALVAGSAVLTAVKVAPYASAVVSAKP